MTITEWPLSERPREKLMLNGAKNLSDAELLAILVNTGIRGKTALDIARELLIDCGGLANLPSSHPHSFYQKRGIGKAKYALLQAALELGRRYLDHDIQMGETLDNSIRSQRFLSNQLKNYPHEVFACAFLNNQHRLLRFEELFHGTLGEANIYPREVVKRALAHNAAKVIFAHNHPSGSAQPSQADLDITQLLKQALALVDISIVDHVIVGHKETTSLAELGMV